MISKFYSQQKIEGKKSAMCRVGSAEFIKCEENAEGFTNYIVYSAGSGAEGWRIVVCTVELFNVLFFFYGFHCTSQPDDTVVRQFVICLNEGSV